MACGACSGQAPPLKRDSTVAATPITGPRSSSAPRSAAPSRRLDAMVQQMRAHGRLNFGVKTEILQLRYPSRLENRTRLRIHDDTMQGGKTRFANLSLLFTSTVRSTVPITITSRDHRHRRGLIMGCCAGRRAPRGQRATWTHRNIEALERGLCGN